MNKKLLLDIAERTGWTAAQAGLGVIITYAAGLPPAYAVPVAGALALLKGYIASHIGEPDSAATLPK
jgi:hydrogenase/urease accessory protein HupE